MLISPVFTSDRQRPFCLLYTLIYSLKCFQIHVNRESCINRTKLQFCPSKWMEDLEKRNLLCVRVSSWAVVNCHSSFNGESALKGFQKFLWSGRDFSANYCHSSNNHGHGSRVQKHNTFHCKEKLMKGAPGQQRLCILLAGNFSNKPKMWSQHHRGLLSKHVTPTNSLMA